MANTTSAGSVSPMTIIWRMTIQFFRSSKRLNVPGDGSERLKQHAIQAIRNRLVALKTFSIPPSATFTHSDTRFGIIWNGSASRQQNRTTTSSCPSSIITYCQGLAPWRWTNCGANVFSNTSRKSWKPHPNGATGQRVLDNRCLHGMTRRYGNARRP